VKSPFKAGVLGGRPLIKENIQARRPSPVYRRSWRVGRPPVGGREARRASQMEMHLSAASDRARVSTARGGSGQSNGRRAGYGTDYSHRLRSNHMDFADDDRSEQDVYRAARPRESSQRHCPHRPEPGRIKNHAGYIYTGIITGVAPGSTR
jgi:hypothetical protein